LIKKEQVCLQEAKCKELGQEEIFKMWGTNEVDWVENGIKNNAGEVITMWRRSCFLLSNFINEKNYSIIEREWRIGEPIQITIVDVYNSGSLEEKRSV